ncbi:sensor histidine kinase [Anaeromicropila herbilytica]|uniref:histidine kinase n=1 Tax=Anaeromicropila herbilytica TaxID=2785025 RepID=A0A7R7EJE0_9FIRM|nr:HAMP domain-containing sensor histidine kinase [Anaeromicropila herbilytica]BCN30220.1 two-component sensor histidine kinase [Anaeromicropila herbilytica]
MEGIVIVILIITSYFSILFFIQNYSIMKARRQLKDICNHPDMNLRLKLKAPGKEVEQLLASMNEYIELYQKDHILHIRREKALKKEIANISHDLRTPLTSILGYIRVLNDEKITDEERMEYLLIIRKKSEVMKTLVESFYELSNVESEDYVLKKEKVYLYNTICEILLAFYQDFESKKIEVILELEEDIPFLMLDQKSVVRIITNLIQNALRYANSLMKIILKKEQNQVTLIFINDMISGSTIEIDRVFDRTYTADDSRSVGGTGLGLSITKKLVELMNGQISAELDNNLFEIKIIWHSNEY